MADDADIYQQIKTLVEEEHELDRGGQAHAQERRAQLEEQLDQLWDLLRQRQARRQAGEDPSDAQPGRSPRSRTTCSNARHFQRKWTKTRPKLSESFSTRW